MTAHLTEEEITELRMQRHTAAYERYRADQARRGYAVLPKERVKASGNSYCVDPTGLTEAERATYGLPRGSSRSDDDRRFPGRFR